MKKRKGRRSVACTAPTKTYHAKTASLLPLPLISLPEKPRLTVILTVIAENVVPKQQASYDDMKDKKKEPLLHGRPWLCSVT
jgi:hypothetical protein